MSKHKTQEYDTERNTNTRNGRRYEICALLGFYAVYVGNMLRMCRGNLSVPSFKGQGLIGVIFKGQGLIGVIFKGKGLIGVIFKCQ